jgi:hypothetical protein
MTTRVNVGGPASALTVAEQWRVAAALATQPVRIEVTPDQLREMAAVLAAAEQRDRMREHFTYLGRALASERAARWEAERRAEGLTVAMWAALYAALFAAVAGLGLALTAGM